MTDHEVTVDGHKFKVSLADIGQFIITALAVVGLYFLSNNRLNNTEKAVNDLYTKHGDLTRQMSDLDRNGTHRSHETDAMQQQMIEQNSAQIAEINRTLRDLSPKVDKIDTNVLWLMAKQLEKK